MNFHTQFSYLFSNFDGIGTINLHAILLSIFSFPEIQRNEGHTFLVGLNTITLTRVT